MPESNEDKQILVQNSIAALTLLQKLHARGHGSEEEVKALAAASEKFIYANIPLLKAGIGELIGAEARLAEQNMRTGLTALAEINNRTVPNLSLIHI